MKIEPGNFMVSPLSAQLILSLLEEGAKDETSTQLITGLNLPNTEINRREAIGLIISHLTPNTEVYDLLTANKIYAAERLEVKSPFMDIAENIYNIEYENVDFLKAEETAQMINQWVEDQTNSKIKNLIDPDVLTEYTLAILINTLYMKANWTSEFQTTVKFPFHTLKGESKEVDMMYQKTETEYFEDVQNGIQYLRLKYKTEDKNDLSMTVILPKEQCQFQVLENNLNLVFSKDIPFYSTSVGVNFPTFKVETSIGFKEILKNLGIVNIFEELVVDLSDLAGDKGEIVVTDVIQKTFINVTETGTEAAAATAIIVSETTSTGNLPSVNFIADHTFLYYISLNGYVLFAGRVDDPSK